MKNLEILINQELNGIELKFAEKPSIDVIESVKANGFKWSSKKRIWWAKNTAERLAFVETLGEVSPAPSSAPSSKVELINMEGVGSKEKTAYGADLAKVIREELKTRGVKGVTVRARRITYDTGITITVKATADDLASIEEAKERYTMSCFEHDVYNNGLYIGDRWLYANEFETMSEEDKEAVFYQYLDYAIRSTNEFKQYHHDRKECFTLSSKFWHKCLCIYQIANQWNYDNSDSMTDYFDVGYYLDIDIKHDKDIELRATMTEEERQALEDERREKAEEFERFCKEQEEKEKQYKEAEAKRKVWEAESFEMIYNNIYIEDLEESEALYIDNLVGDCGKACSIEELKEGIERNPHHNEAMVNRIVKFKDIEAFDRFCQMFLYDFDFLAQKGGTACEDVRISDDFNIYQLTTEQRESIKWFCFNCVAVYLNEELKLVIDPQGYDYARYVFLTDNATIRNASEVLAGFRKESETKQPFYFPKDVEEQTASINIGDEITVYQCDGWILNSIYGGSGVVLGVRPGTYAQHEGVYIDLKNGKKTTSAFIRNTNECLIYKGIKPELPDSITRRQVNNNMYELFNYDKLLPSVYEYYKNLGELPIVDTWQR